MLVERVLGYNGDGHALEVLFLNGVEIRQVTCYELDPDDRMLRYTGSGPWLERQYAAAATASPAAAALIRKWADQTAEHGAVDDLDDDLDEEPGGEPDDGVLDGEVIGVDFDQPPPAQLPPGAGKQ
ncbi:hypothetical protein [Amycolatopsis magusensis]|uniref:hypothetical protein n=1 Tax=Amycolatopsis magusensis TaxID=882444 RepID=UPI003793748F